MPGKTATAKNAKENGHPSHTGPVPSPGVESLPRFAPSPADLGTALAEQILQRFRKDLESVDLRATPSKRRQAQRKRA